jgi:hypothetical protein
LENTMPGNLPLSFVILEIVKRTPTWVWAILLALVVLGVLQMRDRLLSRTRLMITPVGLAAYSLLGAASTFGMRPEVIVAWLAGLAVAIAANGLLQWPRDARPDGKGNYSVPGSAWPLVLMMAIFVMRYIGTVTLVFHPDWATDPQFSLGMTLAYGTLSGLFTARAIRILRSDRSGTALRMA